MSRFIPAFIGVLIVGCCYAGASDTATSVAIENYSSSVHFQDLQDLAAQKQLEAAAKTQTLDSLLEQKKLWQSEVIAAKSKIALAKSRLTDAEVKDNASDVERYQEQVNVWESRLKQVVFELEAVESSINDIFSSARQAKVDTAPENNEATAELILPGESVEVYVTEDDTLNGVYSVRQGGYILMPRVGRISIAGLDLSSAEKAIKKALEVNQLKVATVMVERPQAGGSVGVGAERVIYLAGEFLHPGAWKIPHDLSPSVVTTILRSGGLTPQADLTKVNVLRLVGGQSLAEQVNVQSILSGHGLTSDVTLQPGDIVMVPPFANVVYVTGNVMKPGALKLLPDDALSAYSAILRAGGFSRFANKSKVYILRELGNGDKQKIPVDIRTLQEGGGGDLVLQSKDIVVVPEKFFSF